MASVHYGGYNYEFVGPISEDFTCPICTLVQREAQQVTCCGKIYCESCLKCLKKKGTRFLCPCCRTRLNGPYTVFPDKNAVSKIKHLSIYCTNKERGCKWVGNLKDLEEKHLPECPNEIVCCTIQRTCLAVFAPKVPCVPSFSVPERCGAKVQRHQLEKHMTEECEWRQVKCPHCEEEGSYIHIFGEHEKETCPDVLLPCSNEGCSEQIKRFLKPFHCMVCPKEIVSCQFDTVGCKQKLKREDVDTHDREYMGAHLKKVVTTIEDLQQRLNTAETTNKDLQHRLNKAERSIKRFRRKI